MLDVEMRGDEIAIGPYFRVSFQRTLRIPDDGKTYPLPPGLGPFPVKRVQDYPARIPESWLEHGGVFIPMYQREALWLSFSQPSWRPAAVKVGVGKINAVTGEEWTNTLNRQVQDYLVVPRQPWLDGIKAGDGFVRQFVAMPLGMGYSVEAQLTGKEEWGGIQLIVFDPRPGLFPSEPPRVDESDEFQYLMLEPSQATCSEMGIAAGGKMRQKVYRDNHGVDTWDEKNFGRVYVHIVNSMQYREITGEEPPSTPVSADTYTQAGYPWFDLYDEAQADVEPSGKLAGVTSVKEKDKEHGFGPQQDDSSVEVPEQQTKKLQWLDYMVKDGNW
jgi:hypothetical protein